MSQDTNGKISLTMALTKAKGGGIDVFFANRLSPDLSKTDLSKLFAKSIKIDGLDGKFVVSTLALRTLDNRKRPLALISGQIDTVRSFY